MDRRQILAGIVAGSFSAIANGLSVPGTIDATLADAARLIGNWYLEEYPEESDTKLLQHHLSAVVPWLNAGDALFESAIDRNAVMEACNVDFRRNEVVSVGGWLLSRTELRLCALAAIS